MNPAILYCNDLFFSSKVEHAGLLLGREVVVAPTFEAAEQAITAHGDQPLLMLVDLEQAAEDLEALTAAVRSVASEANLIGYAGHLRTDLFELAHSLGFSKALTRGEFDQQLKTLLS